jgi:hypothetical protein
MLPLNLKRTTSSLAPPIIYVAKNSAIKRYKVPHFNMSKRFPILALFERFLKKFIQSFLLLSFTKSNDFYQIFNQTLLKSNNLLINKSKEKSPNLNDSLNKGLKFPSPNEIMEHQIEFSDLEIQTGKSLCNWQGQGRPHHTRPVQPERQLRGGNHGGGSRPRLGKL